MAKVDKVTHNVKMCKEAKRPKWPKNDQIGENGKNSRT